MQALLELDCMPAGMELFPAASEAQWNWIKKVIDESDYYLVVVGNRYGSISESTGMSYTEMEYRYAVDTGKPVIAFLHAEPKKIESGKSEQSSIGKKKLSQFRKLCQTRLVKYWNSPADLGAKVSRSITQLIKHEPAQGWVRASEIPNDQSAKILLLRDEILTLKKRIKKLSGNSTSVKNLSQGSDLFSIDFSYETKNPKKGKTGNIYWTKGEELDHEIETSWDNIFSYIAPILINPATEFRVVSRMNSFIQSLSEEYMKKNHRNKKIERIRIYSDPFDQIKIQFRALGLIVIDEDNDWHLTDLGDAHMNNLIAIKKA